MDDTLNQTPKETLEVPTGSALPKPSARAFFEQAAIRHVIYPADVLEETEVRVREVLRRMEKAQERSRRDQVETAVVAGLVAGVTAFIVVLLLGLIAYVAAF